MNKHEELLEIAKRNAELKEEISSLKWQDSELVDLFTKCILGGNVDITPYLDKGLGFGQLDEVVSGLIEGVDVSIYAKKEFSEDKMHQIRLGLQDDLDVSLYAKRKFGHKQMLNIRIALMRGEDPKKIFELRDEFN